MKRTLVISDIHGELELFQELLLEAGYDANEDQLILLGDYVDRGPDSKGVLERVIELKKTGAIVLRGNHDNMMLAAVNDEPGSKERWARNGGIPTLQSYDPSIADMMFPAAQSFWAHVEFIRGTGYFHETDDYIFVHAGVQPGTPVEQTDPYTLMWIREEFYLAYEGDKTVVFGHTPAFLLRGTDNHDIFFGDNSIIGIDGGAAYDGQLNCLELPGRKSYSVKKS
ncbi:metallophosphoesterase family protein [Planococcus beigongshangi]|uniref:metallophosphoesterase family protein n=1 Tax=Planococcus beigongshangi TaxID=2782536 RepID=UPI00193B0413|nr:metallophosphoesterase family protein [Planococcus beigongshangi]